MPSILRLASAAAAVALAAPARATAGSSGSSAKYVIDKAYTPSNFLESFTFNSDNDLNGGYVDYVDESNAANIVYVTPDNKLRLGVDATKSGSQLGRGRKSGRLEGNDVFEQGLFIADFAHLPAAACGAWPAFWLTGNEWPTDGEIDIYESWNLNDYNIISIHTDGSSECKIDSANATGPVLTDNCDNHYSNPPIQWANAGCGFSESGSDSPYTSAQGGIYAVEWTGDAIRVWSWAQGAAPADIASANPDPSTWGTPRSYFGGSSCNSLSSLVKQQHLVLNINFCGDGSGNNFAECAAANNVEASPYGCADYVNAHPDAFKDVYFDVNSIKVYQKSEASSSSVVSSAVSTASAASSASSVASSAAITSASSASSASSAATASVSGFPTSSALTSVVYGNASVTHTVTISAISSSAAVSASASYTTFSASIIDCESESSELPAPSAAVSGSGAASVPASATAIVPASTTAAASTSATAWTTSTIYATTTSTILSCPPTVTDCPINSVATIVYAVTTTVCPVTEAEGPGKATVPAAGATTGPGATAATATPVGPAATPGSAGSPSAPAGSSPAVSGSVPTAPGAPAASPATSSIHFFGNGTTAATVPAGTAGTAASTGFATVSVPGAAAPSVVNNAAAPSSLSVPASAPASAPAPSNAGAASASVSAPKSTVSATSPVTAGAAQVGGSLTALAAAAFFALAL